jgi:hypothetical protein
MLRDHHLGAARIDALGNLVRFVLLPGQRYDTVGIEPLNGESEDFGRHATLGLTYGLTRSPPFAPCP